MHVTAMCYHDWAEEEGTLIFDWMLRENGLTLEERWDTHLA